MTNQERAEKIFLIVLDGVDTNGEVEKFEKLEIKKAITSQLDEAVQEAKVFEAERLALEHSKDFWKQGFAVAREKAAGIARAVGIEHHFSHKSTECYCPYLEDEIAERIRAMTFTVTKEL